MNDKPQTEQFAADLEQRFSDLVQWAVSNWPDRERPLSAADLDDARRAVHAITQRLRYPAGEALAPSEGGAQFVNVSPAPWP
jgi:hypothetical protein